eukprot:TRINITY_DN7626_c0_g1_i1.p1 TRINITY_DN7626_c0_g1~~TRINITY_DN7626_c0_g1_i1.p1  ORF type:complete len:792 (+),score=252.99 TRINITY_DN7626_c0_g1_i1:63-2378(+)
MSWRGATPGTPRSARKDSRYAWAPAGRGMYEGSINEVVRVAVRLRPGERSVDMMGRSGKVMGVTRDGRAIMDGSDVKWAWDASSITKNAGAECGMTFNYAAVHDPMSTTETVYKDTARHTVQRVLQGYNGCVFAYGQTNSGKTYTILGTPSQPGIIPLACVDIFNYMKTYDEAVSLLRVSFLEVYNEQIKDLLNPKRVTLTPGEDPDRGIVVLGATEHVVGCLDDVLSLIKEGEARRAQGRNNIHEHASRSHSVFQLVFETRDLASKEIKCSTLSIVDLAGSEANYQVMEVTPTDVLSKLKDQQTISGRLAKNEREERVAQIKEREGSNIRKSLTALVRVVQVLAAGRGDHVPYRDSKLTRMLSGALGGTSSTSIICTVNPVEDKETVATLRFASTAQRVHNRPRAIKIENDKAVLNRYEGAMKEMQQDMFLQGRANEEIIREMKKEKNIAEDGYKDEIRARDEEAEEMKRKMASLSRYILTANKVKEQTTTLNKHYKVSAGHGGGHAMQSEDLPVDPVRRRRHSFDYMLIRDKRSKDLFTSVEGTATTKSVKTDDAVELLKLSNSESMKATQNEVTKGVMRHQKATIEKLEEQFKELSATLEKTGGEKDQMISKLTDDLIASESRHTEEKRELMNEAEVMGERHAEEVVQMAEEKEAAVRRLEDVMEERLQQQEEEYKKKLQRLEADLEEQRRETSKQQQHCAALHQLALPAVTERDAMRRLLEEEASKSSGCTSAGPRPDRWRRHAPSTHEMFKSYPILQKEGAERRRI